MNKINVYQVKLHKVGEMEFDGQLTISSPADAAKIAYKYLEGADREHLIVILLNTKFKVIGINTVHIGSLDSAIAHPREIFKPAILSNASCIMIAHNHPSGDTTPSTADFNVTERIYEAGKLLGIELIDHIIIGIDEFDELNYYSMKEKGVIRD